MGYVLCANYENRTQGDDEQGGEGEQRMKQSRKGQEKDLASR
jgi:hypothetical protein